MNSTPGLRLLVVDDEQQILELLHLTLSLKGYDVATARSGPEALACVERRPFDVIVLDVLMAPWDGFETVRRMQQSVGAALSPVVYLSGLSRPEQLPHGGTEYLTEYLMKPFRPSQLVDLIERIWVEAQRRNL